MRKLILVSAFVLAAASVQAVEARELILAASDSSAVAAPATPAAAQAAAPTAAPVAATSAPAAPTATAPAAPTQASPPATVSRPQPSRVQKSQAQVQAPALTRRQIDEQKARRIAARYGVYW